MPFDRISQTPRGASRAAGGSATDVLAESTEHCLGRAVHMAYVSGTIRSSPVDGIDLLLTSLPQLRGPPFLHILQRYRCIPIYGELSPGHLVLGRKHPLQLS